MRAVSHAREAEGVVFGGGQGGEESEAEGAEADGDKREEGQVSGTGLDGGTEGRERRTGDRRG